MLHGPADDPAVRTLARHGVTLDRTRAALLRNVAVPAVQDDMKLLATLGVDLDAVRARIQASFGADAIDRLYARRRRAGRRLSRGPMCGFTMAPRAKLALEHARRAATTAHRSRISSTDLLIGLLSVSDAMAVQLLRIMGVPPRGGTGGTRSELRRQLIPRHPD